jgi:hypothetical protein
MVVDWEVLLLQEAPQETSEADYMIYLDPDEIDGAQVGKVSSEFRFLHEVTSGLGDFTFVGGREPHIATTTQIECSDGREDWNIWMQAGSWDTTPGRTGTYHATGAEVDI